MSEFVCVCSVENGYRSLSNWKQDPSTKTKTSYPRCVCIWVSDGDAGLGRVVFSALYSLVNILL